MDDILEKAGDEQRIIQFIPKFIVSHVFSDISTKNIRTSLNIDSNPRELVVVVMNKFDGTIMDLSGDDLWNVFWDCVRCEYRFL